MKFIATLFVIAVALSGCSTTVPVTAKFPEAPARIQQTCPQLQKLEDGAKLSDVSKTITNNYTTYYECAVKTDGWIEWYNIQKHIFESVK
jgi:PBP1b-binding outer membrane lipoprotein LpoB